MRGLAGSFDLITLSRDEIYDCISNLPLDVTRIINLTYHATHLAEIFDILALRLQGLRKRILALLLSRSVTHPASEVPVLP
jgi:putative effector of murein hydrolase